MVATCRPHCTDLAARRTFHKIHFGGQSTARVECFLGACSRDGAAWQGVSVKFAGYAEIWPILGPIALLIGPFFLSYLASTTRLRNYPSQGLESRFPNRSVAVGAFG